MCEYILSDSFTLHDLDNAVFCRKFFNKMPLEEFVECIEEYQTVKLDKSKILLWEATGLSNVDFWTSREWEKYIIPDAAINNI